jgi:hypothetical protein
MASLAFMYEDSASSFLASPKAYIILLATAFIASRLNLFYGWDFSGILIPSLLALQWYEPHKIATTFVEAIVILVLAGAVLRLPVFRSMTMEGARKLLLFFNIGFAYKFLLAWGLVLFMPELKVSDWFGFGYLLATLIALKIHDKDIFARMTSSILQTSLTGVAVATAIGFILVLLPDPDWNTQAASDTVARLPIVVENRDIVEVLDAEKTRFYASNLGQQMSVPQQRELDAFAAGVRKLLEYRHTADAPLLESARQSLHAAHYEVVLVNERYLLLREPNAQHHWGTYVLRMDGDSKLLVSVPAPVDEAGTYEAAVALFKQFDARAFASAAASRHANADGSSDVLARPQTMFQVFHRELALRQVLQVRSQHAEATVLHVSGTVPEGVRLKELEQATAGLKLDFTPHSARNLQRLTLRGNFSEIWLNRADVNRIRYIGASTRSEREPAQQGVTAMLRNMVAQQSTVDSAYHGPEPEELLRIEREVLSPLLTLALMPDGGSEPGQAAQAAFSTAQASAKTLGLELRWMTEAARDLRLSGPGIRRDDFLVIADRSRQRGWIVIRIGAARNIVLGVPRPVSEQGTLEAALNAFDDLRARVLVIAGAAPDARRDSSADVLAMNNVRSLYSLMHQTALRDMGENPGVAVQVRAFGIRPDAPSPDGDAVLAFADGAADAASLGATQAELMHALQASGLRVRLGGGARETAGYEASSGPQAWYTNQTRNKDFAVMWVSPLVRRDLHEEAGMAGRRQFAALGLPVAEGAVVEELAKRRMSAQRLPAGLQEGMNRYRETNDVVLLSALRGRHAELGFERLDDTGGRGAYLLVTNRERELLAVMSLAARLSTQTETKVEPGPLPAQAVSRFVSSRSQWLVVK